MVIHQVPHVLDPAWRDTLWAEGFVVPLGFALPVAPLDDIRLALHDRVAAAAEAGVTLELRNLRTEIPAIAELTALCRPVANTLTGRDDMRCNFDELLVAPAGLAAGTAWHQDEASSRLGRFGLRFRFRRPDTSMTFWIPLQPVSVDNGALRYQPGSHRTGLRHHERTANGGPRYLPGVDDGTAVTVALEVGQCVVHNGEVIHGAAPNPSSSARWAIGIQFRPGPSSFVQRRADVGGWPQPARLRRSA
jgi:ectoine hydroxylase-related dioxygenase (phytanoyl-CoA dioxygenase family)